MSEKYAKKDYFDGQAGEIETKIEDHTGKITKLVDQVRELNANLSQEIHSAVRRVATGILQ